LCYFELWGEGECMRWMFCVVDLDVVGYVNNLYYWELFEECFVGVVLDVIDVEIEY